MGAAEQVLCPVHKFRNNKLYITKKMRNNHETDILQKCCRVCGKTSPKGKIHRLRPDEANWFGIQLTRDDKLCWVCKGLYTAHKENEFDKGNF